MSPQRRSCGVGCYKPFEQMLGVGSFDDSFLGSRHEFLMANPCPLSTAMAVAWLRCRQGMPAADLAVFGLCVRPSTWSSAGRVTTPNPNRNPSPPSA